MDKFKILYEANKFLRKRSHELRRFKCYSTWYYDEPERNIVICTNWPGLWIGYHGEDLDKLRNDINSELASQSIEPIDIKFIECEG